MFVTVNMQTVKPKVDHIEAFDAFLCAKLYTRQYALWLLSNSERDRCSMKLSLNPKLKRVLRLHHRYHRHFGPNSGWPGRVGPGQLSHPRPPELFNPLARPARSPIGPEEFLARPARSGQTRSRARAGRAGPFGLGLGPPGPVHH
jgi:hypothetical protein